MMTFGSSVTFGFDKVKVKMISLGVVTSLSMRKSSHIFGLMPSSMIRVSPP